MKPPELPDPEEISGPDGEKILGHEVGDLISWLQATHTWHVVKVTEGLLPGTPNDVYIELGKANAIVTGLAELVSDISEHHKEVCAMLHAFTHPSPN